ncbi:MAG TPA: efflux RND transporter periplasmic adaptor subunit [Steroidobacteraceae bacterium]|jgi:RND family efflux transporter MFP subunit
MRSSFVLISLAAVVALTVSGCARDEAATPSAMPPPAVTVAKVVTRPVTEFDEFTGRFEAVDRVELRPRVSGYIASINFTQGKEVKKGDVLVVIDPRPYQADYNRAKAQLAQARTQRDLAKSEQDRAVKLLAQHAISKEEYDTRTSGSEQADANVQAAQAALDSASLNLEFTRVTAPITGVVGRAEITEGNFVTTGQTRLTTLVSTDPIYVSFDGDEQAYLKYMEFARTPKSDNQQPVWVGLADESGYPHKGVMVFVNNEIDPQTGTVRARGSLENHDHQFTPGMFARVKLPGGPAHNALLINDSAVGTDQSAKYVLVVGKDNKVEYRPVQLGPIVDGLRVVREGLSSGDTIVVNGLQRVRPGAPVTPQLVAMGEPHPQGAAQAMVAQNSKVE